MYNLFDIYKNENDPIKKEKINAWKTAFGLQGVDNLQVSPYLIHLAIKNIEGDITMDQVEELLEVYYDKTKK